MAKGWDLLWNDRGGDNRQGENRGKAALECAHSKTLRGVREADFYTSLKRGVNESRLALPFGPGFSSLPTNLLEIVNHNLLADGLEDFFD